MGHATDHLGNITESPHARQRAAMDAHAQDKASERADVDAAFALLQEWLREARAGRQFAGLVSETETLLVRRHNQMRTR